MTDEAIKTAEAALAKIEAGETTTTSRLPDEALTTLAAELDGRSDPDRQRLRYTGSAAPADGHTLSDADRREIMAALADGKLPSRFSIALKPADGHGPAVPVTEIVMERTIGEEVEAMLDAAARGERPVVRREPDA